MLSVEIMPNGLIFVQCRKSGLRCCFRYSRIGWGMVRVGDRAHGDLSPEPEDVRVALQKTYPILSIVV